DQGAQILARTVLVGQRTGRVDGVLDGHVSSLPPSRRARNRTERTTVMPGGSRSLEAPMAERTKYVLDEADMPTRWYNLIPDLPEPPPPPLHPGTREPVGPDDLAPLFPQALIAQEVTTDSYVDIPDEVLDVYRLWRPTPLFRARRLEKALGTPAR